MTHVKITSYRHPIKGEAEAAPRSTDKPAVNVGIAAEYHLRLGQSKGEYISELAIRFISYHHFY